MVVGVGEHLCLRLDGTYMLNEVLRPCNARQHERYTLHRYIGVLHAREVHVLERGQPETIVHHALVNRQGGAIRDEGIGA